MSLLERREPLKFEWRDDIRQARFRDAALPV